MIVLGNSGDYPDPVKEVYVVNNDLKTWDSVGSNPQRVKDPNFLKAHTGPYPFVKSKQIGWDVTTKHPNEVWYLVTALDGAGHNIDVWILALDPANGLWNTSPTKPMPTPDPNPNPVSNGTLVISLDAKLQTLLETLINAVVAYLNAKK